MRRLTVLSLLALFSSAHATFCVPEPGASDEFLRELNGNPVSLTETIHVPGNPKTFSLRATFAQGRVKEWVWLESGQPGHQRLAGVLVYDQTSVGTWLGKLGLPLEGKGIDEKITLARKNIAAGRFKAWSTLSLDRTGRVTGFQGILPQFFLTGSMSQVSATCRYEGQPARKVTETVNVDGKYRLTSAILLDGVGHIQSIRSDRQLYDGPLDMDTLNSTLSKTVHTSQVTYVYGAGNRLTRVDTTELSGTSAARPSETTAYRYDGKGTIVGIDATLDSRSSSQTFRYDTHGHWVEKTERTAGGDTIITTRTITY